MEQILGFIENIKSVQVIDVLMATCIMILFIVLSPSISYMIVKSVKLKGNKKQIRNVFMTRVLQGGSFRGKD